MSPWLTSYLSGAEHDTEDEARAAGEHQTDPPSRSLAELAGSAETVEPLGEAPVEAGTAPLDEERRSPLPGRPETVPAVTLSWREAEVFDVSIPEVESRDRAIVVEPPSQVVAQSRSRRRPLDAGPQIEGGVAGGVPGDDRAVAPTVAPAVDSAPSVPDAPLPTRAAARAASGNRSGKRRRILVVGLALVMVVVVAGYFLLAHGVAVASAR